MNFSVLISNSVNLDSYNLHKQKLLKDFILLLATNHNLWPQGRPM